MLFRFCRIRRSFGGDAWLALDVCLCSHTAHGHCGVLNDSWDHVENDATVDELARAAVTYAAAGADCVAPSDMMDGRVAAIRAALDGCPSGAPPAAAHSNHAVGTG